MSDFAAETVILISDSDHGRTMKPMQLRGNQDNKQDAKGNIEPGNRRVMPQVEQEDGANEEDVDEITRI